jgi:hypothetical protein
MAAFVAPSPAKLLHRIFALFPSTRFFLILDFQSPQSSAELFQTVRSGVLILVRRCRRPFFACPTTALSAIEAERDHRHFSPKENSAGRYDADFHFAFRCFTKINKKWQ